MSNIIQTPISYKTYKLFAKKYKIKLSKYGIKKPIELLKLEIERHEIINNIKNGLFH